MSLLRKPAGTTTPAYEDSADSNSAALAQPTKPTPQGNTVTTDVNPKSLRCTTGVVRGSYVKIFKAELQKNAKPGDIPKFGMTILIPKDDAATLKKLADCREAAILAKWPAKRPAKIDTTLHDGDLPRPSNGEEFGPECKGHWVMAVNSKFKPTLGDTSGNEIIDPNEVGSGDYFKVSLGAYGYDTSGNRGVAFGLNNVLFVKKGESLGGKTSFADDFADDMDQAG